MKGVLGGKTNQLDAVELDDEIENILRHQVLNITKHLPVGFLGRWEPEIEALIRFAIWKVKTAFSWAETSIKLASVINFLVFLQEGKHPTLTDRILCLRPVSVAPSGQARTVGYSYMTRELLWHGFIEFLVFALPLLNYHSVKRRLTSLMMWKKKDVKPSNIIYTSNTKCAECNEPPVLPHHMGCSHVFCYYCLKANLLADEKYECPLCGFCAGDATLIKPFHLNLR
ncbi:hypothetical protein C0J52_05142 [Blattella germanica]|nr:hypothetical protein C0J52_05142 [Blattella germanica]